MITEDERFIKIQGILTLSDIDPADCIKINDLIIELSKENQQLKIQISAREEEYRKLEDNWNKLKEYIDIKLYNVEYLQKLCGCRIDDVNHLMLKIIKNKIKELERSDSNE